MYIQKIDYKSKFAARKFAESLHETGFAIIENPPVSYSLVQHVIEEWKIFFKSDNKLDYIFNPETLTGFFPYKSENAKGNEYANLMEYFHIKTAKDFPKGISLKTYDLYQQGIEMALVLTNWLLKESPKDIAEKFPLDMESALKKSKLSLMRILHYPQINMHSNDNSVRAAEHEDISFLSLLPASSKPGLQVKDQRDVWHDVGSSPGEVIVNAGDMLQALTEGYYPSATHRVVNPRTPKENVERFSTPMFITIQENTFVSKGFTAFDYLNERMRENGILQENQSLKLG